MQRKSQKSPKKLAAKPAYVSPNQLTLLGFETPFVNQLNKDIRWVKMAQAIPWDKIVPYYDQLFSSSEGRAPISGRVIIGAMIIKHIEDLTDRAAILHIQENMFMQYFLGYSSFTNEAPFTAPLFVAIRKRMSLELTTKISEVIALHCMEGQEPEDPSAKDPDPPESISENEEQVVATPAGTASVVAPVPPPQGRLIIDATVAPQNITYPTDLKLLCASRSLTFSRTGSRPASHSRRRSWCCCTLAKDWKGRTGALHGGISRSAIRCSCSARGRNRTA